MYSIQSIQIFIVYNTQIMVCFFLWSLFERWLWDVCSVSNMSYNQWLENMNEPGYAPHHLTSIGFYLRMHARVRG